MFYIACFWGESSEMGIRVCFPRLYVVLCPSFDIDFYTLSTAESIDLILTDIISLNDRRDRRVVS